MSEDSDWTMADGFAPPERITYCKRQTACVAPSKGACPYCQPRGYANNRRYRATGSVPLTINTVPSYVDADFDDMGLWRE